MTSHPLPSDPQSIEGLAPPAGPPLAGHDPSAGPAAVDRVLAQLAEMDTAREELDVVEEELRVQQEQLQQLLSRYESERRWRTHLSTLIPVGLAVTDGYGKVLEANPALAAHLGVPLHRLRSKPLGVFLHRADLPGFRNALRELAGGTAAEHRSTITIRPRQDDERRVQLFGFPETTASVPGEARVQWVVVQEQSGVTALAAVDDASTESLGLVTALASLSVLPTAENDQQSMLRRMAALVRGAVPGAGWVSITLGAPKEPQRLASDSAEAQEFDGLQFQAQEGPCWTAYATGSVTVCGDVGEDDRWPDLAKLAGDAPVRSVLALPVRVTDERRGVVNVYAGRRHAFGPTNRQIAELVAGAVAGVLQNVSERDSLQQLTRHLESALTSRAAIDQAKGVLMARLGVDADEAFARLVSLSSRLNVKVRELARLVISGDAEAVISALG
jgi:GAF domain-containing protein